MVPIPVHGTSCRQSNWNFGDNLPVLLHIDHMWTYSPTPTHPYAPSPPSHTHTDGGLVHIHMQTKYWKHCRQPVYCTFQGCCHNIVQGQREICWKPEKHPFVIQLPRSMGFITTDDVVCFHGNGVQDQVHELIIFIHVWTTVGEGRHMYMGWVIGALYIIYLACIIITSSPIPNGWSSIFITCCILSCIMSIHTRTECMGYNQVS